MKIYIQSRGSSPDFDYAWQPEVPSFLSRISGYIQSESPSVVLCRFDSKLFLLVTALESATKKDFAGRVIRHSVGWVCDDNNENEMLLRAIAVEALQGVLSSKVDKLVDLDRKTGFSFQEEDFKKLGNSILQEGAIENSPLAESEITRKIAKNSQKLKEHLAYKTLKRFKLPSNYELLVVVTGIKSEDSLSQANIWRSLSNLVQSEQEQWKTVSNTKKEGQKQNFLMAIALILLLVAIAVIILLTMILH
jgi:hypothetical protein